jgi:hypothetical protein
MQVVVEAVAHPDKGMDLHSFFNLLYRVAPIRGLLKWSGTEGAAQQHNQQKEVLTDEQVEAHLKRGEPFTLLEIIPKLSYNVNILAALDRAVQVWYAEMYSMHCWGGGGGIPSCQHLGNMQSQPSP